MVNNFMQHQLLKRPEEYRKVQQEVDDVVGKGPITVQHMQKLPYIAAVSGTYSFLWQLVLIGL